MELRTTSTFHGKREKKNYTTRSHAPNYTIREKKTRKKNVSNRRKNSKQKNDAAVVVKKNQNHLNLSRENNLNAD